MSEQESLLGNINRSFRRKLLVGIFITFFITFTVFSTGSVLMQRGDVEESSWAIMEESSKLLAQIIEDRIEAGVQLFESISEMEEIYYLAAQVYHNDTLATLFDAQPLANKSAGTFYVPYLQEDPQYKYLLKHFNQLSSSIENLALVRLFAPDGNVIVGSAYGEEDVKDYKGDKGWFKNVIGDNPIYSINETEISAISQARRMNSEPAIRYVRAIGNNGTQRHGVLVINISAQQITDYVQAETIGLGGHAQFIDLNYINAEGTNLGEVYLANGYDESLTFDEENAGNIALKEEMFSNSGVVQTSGRIEFTLNSTGWNAAFHKVGDFEHDWVVLSAISKDVFASEVNKIVFYELVSRPVTLLIVMLAVAWIINRSIKPMYKMVEGTQDIAKGNLTVEIPVSSSDEFGLLSRNFNEMTGSLRNVIGNTRSTTIILQSSAEELQSGTEEINASAEEVASTSQAMSNGATTQTELINEVSEEIKATTKLVDEIITSIRNNTNQVSQIALQTNILALNAGIEASRAGDYGRGFAVVAENIRKLSDQSKSASESISEVADEIASRLEEAFSKISATMLNVVSVSEETAASAEEVAAAAEEMTATIEEIASAAQELSTQAEESLKNVNRFILE